MTTMRRVSLIFALVCLISGMALAQSGGQLWVRSYEDRNANGVRDTGEPLLTRGVSVDLLNADGIIIASALLDSSPNAAQGLVGFQMLPPGEYSVIVSSADYEPTTGGQLTAMVSDAGVPPVLEYGAVPVEVPATTTAEAAEDDTRPLLAVGGAVAIMLLMAIIGALIYALFFRPRLKHAQQLDLRATGGMRPVTTGTGEYVVPRGTGQFERPADADAFKPPATPKEPVIDEYDFPLDPEDTPRP